MDLLRQIETMVEELQSTEKTRKRRGGNKQYSVALERLLYFTDHTNSLGQMFTSSVSYTSFLQRIAYVPSFIINTLMLRKRRTWTLFLKAVGLRLEKSQTDSIVRTFVRCHERPYLKIACTMWKYIFTKTERVYPLVSSPYNLRSVTLVT